MKFGRAKTAMKEARNEIGMTQLQLSLETFDSRENISHIENGRHKVHPTISNYFTTEHNNPWVAVESAAEYTSWGPVKLDGDYVDLHRSSVREKTLEELTEALEAIGSVCIANNPKSMKEFEKTDLEKSLIEAIDAIVALTHYVAIICKEYGISWLKVWTKQRTKLLAKGYLKN